MIWTVGDKEFVYYKRDAGKYFTKKEFIRYVEKKTLKTIQKYNLLKHDDIIAVAVSGGKDSVALLYVLDKIEREFNTELIVIHVDEGIKGYSEYSEPIVRKHAGRLGLKIYTTSFKELFGFTIDDVARFYRENRVPWEPCSFCGEWRRWSLNHLALRAGASVIATAHTLDDISQTILMNVMRNSLDRLIRLSIFRVKPMKGFVPRVYPFMELYEKETALYTHLLELEHNDNPCPYAEFSMRWDLRLFLYSQEQKHPGLLYNILRFFQDLKSRVPENKPSLNFCKICGYPTMGTICRAHFLQRHLETIRTSRTSANQERGNNEQEK